MVLEFTDYTLPLLDRELLKRTGIMGLVSGELVAFIGGGYWLGGVLDRHWQATPAFTVSLTLLGLAYAAWRIFRLAKEWMR
jgi:F0F1-type ATP synthase assembly protein I